MGELAVSRAFGDADFKKSIQVGDLLIMLPLLIPSSSYHPLSHLIILIITFALHLQSIIEEEGGSIKQQGPDDIPWDQPLIIAEPDTKVSERMSEWLLWKG
jgi:hypothetical protein